MERRQHVSAIAEDVRIHDRAALARLPSDQLREQALARQQIYEHVRAVWEQAKADGLNPAVQPEWASVAMLCDLTGDLWSAALDSGSRPHP